MCCRDWANSSVFDKITVTVMKTTFEKLKPIKGQLFLELFCLFILFNISLKLTGKQDVSYTIPT